MCTALVRIQKMFDFQENQSINEHGGQIIYVAPDPRNIGKARVKELVCETGRD